jgi:hypothetical protein
MKRALQKRGALYFGSRGCIIDQICFMKTTLLLPGGYFVYFAL